MLILTLAPMVASLQSGGKSPVYTSKETWYGPAEVEFSAPTQGNPYDPDTNDVEVKFTDGAGHDETRLAFWTGTDWKSILLTQFPGKYKATPIVNGTAEDALPAEVDATAPEKTPFLRIAPDRRSFVLSNGGPLWPLGHDLGWHNGGDPLTIEAQLQKMGAAGITWTRIWACAWDGKNPWWSVPIGQLDQKSLTQWDAIIAAASTAGVRFQWTLYHHGEVSSRVDPNWPDSPYNSKNGGFLNDPEEFFTDPRAMKLEKAYLRYIVARYAASPWIFSWEIFNEVQWANAALDKHWDKITAWHQVMAKYIRSLDPYGHPITSSSDLPDAIWRVLDYYQPHGYPASVESMILGDKPKTDRPYFYGEVGPSGQATAEDHRRACRDGIWAGILAGDSGSGMYWYWDQVSKNNFYPEYQIASKIIKDSDLMSHPDRQPLAMRVQSALGANLSFSPGQGWASAKQNVFELPTDAMNGLVGTIPTFLQGPAHKEMGTTPLTFKFVAPMANKALLKFTSVSKGGAHVIVTLDEAKVFDQKFASSDKDQNISFDVSTDFKAGPHTLVIDNTEGDWVVLSKVTIGGLAPVVSVHGIGDSSFALLRVQRSEGLTGPARYRLGGLSLANGTYQWTETNLDDGRVITNTIAVRGGALVRPMTAAAKDAIVTLMPSNK